MKQFKNKNKEYEILFNEAIHINDQIHKNKIKKIKIMKKKNKKKKLFEFKDLFSKSFYTFDQKKTPKQKKPQDISNNNELDDLEKSTVKLNSNRLKNKKKFILGLKHLTMVDTEPIEFKSVSNALSSQLEKDLDMLKNSQHRSKIAQDLKIIGLSSDDEDFEPKKLLMKSIKLKNLSKNSSERNSFMDMIEGSARKIDNSSFSSHDPVANTDKRGMCSINISLKPLENKKKTEKKSKAN